MLESRCDAGIGPWCDARAKGLNAIPLREANLDKKRTAVVTCCLSLVVSFAAFRLP